MNRKLNTLYFVLSMFAVALVMTSMRPSVESPLPIVALFIAFGLSVFFGVGLLLSFLKISEKYTKIISLISGVSVIAIAALSSFASIGAPEVIIFILVTLIIAWYLHRLT